MEYIIQRMKLTNRFTYMDEVLIPEQNISFRNLETFYISSQLFVFCFNLGFALLQTGSSAPALPPEGGFGTPHQPLVSHSSPRVVVVWPSCLTPPPVSANVVACLTPAYILGMPQILILRRARHTVYWTQLCHILMMHMGATPWYSSKYSLRRTDVNGGLSLTPQP